MSAKIPSTCSPAQRRLDAYAASVDRLGRTAQPPPAGPCSRVLLGLAWVAALVALYQLHHRVIAWVYGLLDWNSCSAWSIAALLFLLWGLAARDIETREE